MRGRVEKQNTFQTHFFAASLFIQKLSAGATGVISCFVVYKRREGEMLGPQILRYMNTARCCLYAKHCYWYVWMVVRSRWCSAGSTNNMSCGKTTLKSLVITDVLRRRLLKPTL